MNYSSADEMVYEPVYTIGHAASKLGLAVQTLRMYEHAGLIIPYRTSTNRRLYSRQDIKNIKTIMVLIREHHFTIEAIKRFAALIPCWELTNCPDKIRNKCSAYHDSIMPCWLIPGLSCGALNGNCRKCKVYLTCPETLINPKNTIRARLK